MIKTKIEVRNFQGFGSVFNSVAKPFSLKIAEKVVQGLKREIPEREGKLKNSIEIQSPKVIDNKWVVEVMVGKDIPYAWAIWKGLNPEYYSVSPKNSPFMIFPREDWPQYDGRFGNIDVFFFKKTLRNNIPANDFIGRGTKINLNFLERVLARLLKVTYG